MAADPDDALVSRSRFLADLSHEVRSPLHAIIGFSELLTDEVFGKLNAEQQSVVGDIHCAAEHLLRMINDILDISRLEMAKLDLETETLSLAAIVDQAVQIARGLAHEKEVTLEAHVDPGLAVQADERRVLQILNNLLANAIRYSPPRTVVQITAWRDGAYVWTAVRDDGPGIGLADQSRIFGAFVALKNGDIEPGAGLGLSVCKNLLRAMGGEIEVESTPGDGATFRFSLPAAERPG